MTDGIDLVTCVSVFELNIAMAMLGFYKMADPGAQKNKGFNARHGKNKVTQTERGNIKSLHVEKRKKSCTRENKTLN